MKKHNVNSPVILALLSLILFAGFEYAYLEWEQEESARLSHTQYIESLENNFGGAYTEGVSSNTLTEEEQAELEAAAQARMDAGKDEMAARAVTARAEADALSEKTEDTDDATQTESNDDDIQDDAEDTEINNSENATDEDKPTEDETEVATDEETADEEAERIAAEEEARAQAEAEKAAAEAAKAQEEAERAAAEAAQAQAEAEKAAAQAEMQASVSEYATEVADIVNQYRADAGLPPLTLSPSLCEAADIRAAELLTSFSHTRPSGQTCFSAFDSLGIPYGYAGENIAAGQTSPTEVMNSWINSPGHKKNIMNPNFTKIGIACCYDASAPYSYYWVQMFTD